nr:MAG TPA: hypothetical protein [Caudoviricetes sp.]
MYQIRKTDSSLKYWLVIYFININKSFFCMVFLQYL